MRARTHLKIALSAAALTAGCAAPDWHADSPTYYQAMSAGRLDEAAADVERCAHQGVATDQLLFDLDAGAILRADGNPGGSTARLDAADALVGDYQQWPDVRLSEEATAAVTSARTTAYRGTLSDLVMLNTYRALNHLEQGQDDAARSTLIRAQFVQQDIAQKYAAEPGQGPGGDRPGQAEGRDGSFDADKTLAANDQQNGAAYRDLLNVRAYADLRQPVAGPSDYVQGHHSLLLPGPPPSTRPTGSGRPWRSSGPLRWSRPTRTCSRTSPPPTAPPPPAAAAPAPVTYVIFETGVAPAVGQVQGHPAAVPGQPPGPHGRALLPDHEAARRLRPRPVGHGRRPADADGPGLRHELGHPPGVQGRPVDRRHPHGDRGPAPRRPPTPASARASRGRSACSRPGTRSPRWPIRRTPTRPTCGPGCRSPSSSRWPGSEHPGRRPRHPERGRRGAAARSPSSPGRPT